MDFKFMYQRGYKVQPFCPEIHSLKRIHWICTRLFRPFLSSQFLLQGEHRLIPTYVHDQQYHSARLRRRRTANAFHLAFLTMISITWDCCDHLAGPPTNIVLKYSQSYHRVCGISLKRSSIRHWLHYFSVRLSHRRLVESSESMGGLLRNLFGRVQLRPRLKSRKSSIMGFTK